MTTHRPDDHLLDRYLAGDATAEERALVQSWLTAHPFRGSVLDTLRTQDTLPAEHIDRVIATIERSIDAGSARSGTQTPARGTRLRHRIGTSASNRPWGIRGMFTGVGAVALVALGVVVARTATRHVATQTSQQYQTKPGQQSTVHLADGSAMTLGPSTSAVVTPNAVTVTGQVYFSIVSHPSHPFVVHTANATVQVLGTKFTVRQYPSEPASQVVVEDGKVALSVRRQSMSRNSRTILTARMLGRVLDSTVTATTNVPVRDYTSWTEGRLVFDNVPLRDVVTELARAYAVDIRVADTTLATQPVSMAAWVQKDPLGQVLDLLTQAVNAHINRVGAAVLITPGRATVHAPRSTRFPNPEQQYGR